MLTCMTAYGILQARLRLPAPPALATALRHAVSPQERVVSRPFGADEYFDFTTVLVLANRVFTCAVAAAVSALSAGGGGGGPSPRALLAPCVLVAATNGAATFCQYEALRFVSFAGVTLAKSAKMLPVLLWVRTPGSACRHPC